MKRIELLISVCLLALVSCSSHSGVREPAVAGQFYPSDPGELAKAVDAFLLNVPSQQRQGAVVALILPHAGYVFSGQTAAYGYALLSGAPIDTVILIGNSHNFRLSRGAVYAEGKFKTPLGEVEIDTAFARKLMENTPLLEANAAPHVPEHSLEVQLPFLQRALKDFRIVPILLSDSPFENCRTTGKALAKTVRDLGREKTTLIIASSDMSHYPSWTNANMTDSAALRALEKFDPPALKQTISGLMSSSVPNLDCVFCGEEAVYTAMYAAQELGAQKAAVLSYTNSGNVLGDKSRVVGYAAAALMKETKKNDLKENSMPEFSLSRKAQDALLKIARQSIENYLRTGKLPDLQVTDNELTALSAVFVTLTQNGDLRGCIGTTAPQEPLYKAVNRMAVAAAVEDHRFPPVRMNDLAGIRIEISVLSPMTRVKSADEIKQGTDGVVVRSGGRSGLFLPQVWEHFDKKEDFLNELCRQKAGLNPQAWNDGRTELYTFTVFAFEEK